MSPIKTARLKLDLSQSEVAIISDIQQSKISAFERGLVEPSREEYQSLSNKLLIDFEGLMLDNRAFMDTRKKEIEKKVTDSIGA